MKKERWRAFFWLLVSIFYLYETIAREKYPLLENVKQVYKYYYIPSIWCIFVCTFNFVMTFLKDKGAFMKKLDEKGKIILLVLTLVLGNDYIFFLSMKMSQANGIQNPLDALELLVSYIVIILTAIVTVYFIYKTIRDK